MLAWVQMKACLVFFSLVIAIGAASAAQSPAPKPELKDRVRELAGRLHEAAGPA